MRARLILHLRGAAFDQHLEHVEARLSTSVLARGRTAAMRCGDLVRGRLVAHFAQHRVHPLHEWIDVRRRVADDRIGKSGQ